MPAPLFEWREDQVPYNLHDVVYLSVYERLPTTICNAKHVSCTYFTCDLQMNYHGYFPTV
eukprot:m.472781 g.472781  ORF g.472781 m.472781 type:complete len:60 (-) comp33269_c0_seq1:116-295(-)